MPGPHSALFRPSTRAAFGLVAVAVLAIGCALYLRYRIIEPSSVGLACQAGLDSWLCLSRRIAIALFSNSVFGITALIVAALQFLRPSLVLFGVALAAAGFGVVLYNINLSALATAVLILSLARRAARQEFVPGPE